MNLINLDSATRQFMRDEIERDIANGVLYVSPRLSARGMSEYADLLLEAADSGTPDSLASALSEHDRLNETEMSTSRSGAPIVKKVPVNAAETLAEGEFNRFYARGLCRRAIDENVETVRVYRAKLVTQPRSESEQMIGQHIDAERLIDDLRSKVGVEPALGLPPGPNSGLSVELLS